MSRLIDADALIEHMRKAYNKRISDWDLISTVAVIGAEEDAEPVRHGHWIITNKPNIYGGTIIKCSECGYEGVIAHIEDHHYCWVCGAKMDANASQHVQHVECVESAEVVPK